MNENGGTPGGGWPSFKGTTGTLNLPFWLFICSFSLFSLLIFWQPPTQAIGNQASHIQLLKSLVQNGAFEIIPENADVSTVDGKIYSNKPPGYALVLWPAFELLQSVAGGHTFSTFQFTILACLFNALLSTGTVIAVYRYLSLFTLSPLARGSGAVSAGFATLLPAYTTLAISAPLTIFLTVLALYLVQGAIMRVLPPERSLAFAAGCMSLAFIADYKIAAFLLPLALVTGWLLLKAGTRAKLGAIVLAMIPLAALAYYNIEVFGRVLVFSYAYYQPRDYVSWPGLEAAFSLANMPRAAWELTLGTARGMLPLSPVVALGIACMPKALQSSERRAILLPIAMALSGFVFICSYVFWFGGHSVGYRHVLTSAVLLAMLPAFCFDALRRSRAVMAGYVMVFIVSIAFSLVAFKILHDPVLMADTWREEQGVEFGDFFTDLMARCLTEGDRC